MAATACSEPSQEHPTRYEPVETVLAGYRMQNWQTGDTVHALSLEGTICLTSTEQMRGRITDLEHQIPRQDTVYFLEAHGKLSIRGRYGHMGTCTYLFEVREVIQDRPLTAGEEEAFASLGRNFFLQPSGEDPGAGFDRWFAED